MSNILPGEHDATKKIIDTMLEQFGIGEPSLPQMVEELVGNSETGRALDGIDPLPRVQFEESHTIKITDLVELLQQAGKGGMLKRQIREVQDYLLK